MILQSMKMAVKSIRSNKMRSFLTMLGIIIGVFALVVLVSLVNGASGTITDSISSLGNNLISVTISDDHGRPMKVDDVNTLMDEEWIAAAAPTGQTMTNASTSYASKTATITGTTAPYAEIQGLTLSSGRFLMKPDEENHSNVIVINHNLAVDVMGRTDVVGESIRVGGQNFQIIGVLEEEENTLMSMFSGSYTAYIPYSTLVRLSSGVSRNVTSFYIAATDDNIEEAENTLQSVLAQRFEQDEEAFSMFSMSSISDAMGQVTSMLSLLLGGIAGISLLVGGIGIMNIMLVSVTERTREIGIRKAIGAGYWTIMLQFLIEALMVSLIGCLIGLVISWVAMQIINAIGNVSFGVAPSVAILSVVFSMAIGVLFGIYPANKAARKKPIDALRYNG